MSYRITLGDATRTFQDIAEAAEEARRLSLDLDGSVVKVFDAKSGQIAFIAKSTRKKN